MENNIESNVVDKKKNKGLIITIIVLSIITVLLGSVIVYFGFINNDNKKESDNQNNTGDNGEVRKGKKLVLYHYTFDYGDNVYESVYPKEQDFSNNSADIKLKKYEFTCFTDECELLEWFDGYDKDGIVVVKEDNHVELVEYKKDKVIDKFDDVKSYAFTNNVTNTIILTKSDGTNALYDYKKKKVVVPFQNIEFNNIGYFVMDVRGPYYDVVFGNGIIAVKNNKYGVIDYNSGKQIIDFKYDDILCYSDTDYIYDAKDNESSYKEYPVEYCKVKTNGKYELITYNKNTKEITKTNYKIDDFYHLFGDKYAYINQNNTIKLIDLNTFKEVASFPNFNSNNPFFFAEDSNNNYMIQFHTKDKDYRCIEYYYKADTNESGVIDDLECAAVGKPILYLYPEEKTEVTVDFSREDLLTTTYPKFVNEWKVTANPNGDLYDSNGNYYYGLYWEETPIHRVDFKEGFYVEADNAIEFLEEKLKTIGLSDRERNEFIMYWLPILEKNGKSLIYFELTDEREMVNKIKINPKPDSLLRIVMHVKKVDAKTKIKKQELTTFNRKGFVAVEWGGLQYK